MKATSKSESGNTLGFWARLARALAAMEMSSIERLELRIERLENQVERVSGASEGRSGNISPTDDERSTFGPPSSQARIDPDTYKRLSAIGGHQPCPTRSGDKPSATSAT